MMRLLFVCLGIILVANYAKADTTDKGGLFLEPILSYENSNFDVNFPSPLGSLEGDYKGAGIGARIGGHVYESFFIGLDARYNKYDINDDGDNYSADSDGYTYGTVVGLQLPTTISARVWWNWVMGGQVDPDSDGGIDVRFEDATGYRIGAGVMFGKFSVNLEYQDITYENTVVEAGGGSANFDNVELNNDGYVVSVSFPFAM